MRALVPAPGTRVCLAQVPEPTPSPDEAVIAVGAFSVNRGETFLLENPSPGWRPGKDIAGVVVRPASDGTGPKIGTRVVAHPERGGWAERASVPTNRLAALPDEIGLLTAAALPLAGLTALRLLRATGPILGQRVLLTGASGGVGHATTELAAAHGALVSAVSASPERGRRLLELGAADVVPSVDKATGPYDVGLDSVGGSSTAAVLRTLRPDGQLVWFGQASRTPATLDFFDWSGGANATIRKFSYADTGDPVDADLATLVRLTTTNRLHPELGLQLDWSQTNDAVAALLERRLVGNAVLTIAN